MVRARQLSAVLAVALSLSAAMLTPPSARAARPQAPRPFDEYVGGQIICSLNPGYSLTKLNHRWGTSLIEYYVQAGIYLLSIPAGANPETFSEQIGTDPACAFAEPNYYLHTAEAIRQMVISATGFTYQDFIDQTAFERVGLEAAHQLSQGSGITVAVLDTGIDTQHSVFMQSVGMGWDFVDDDATPLEVANGIDDDGDGMVDAGFGHGTMVSGIIRTIAPGATIMPLRVLDDEGRGTVYDVASAIYWASHHGARVINMSLGLRRTSESITRMLADAADEDVVLVAGAGNDNLLEPPFFPASDPHCLMIAALDSMDVKASFSDYNALVFVSAPGVAIRSSYPGDLWASGSGCSFATPFAAGEAALVASRYPGISAAAARDHLASGVQSIDGIPGNEPFQGLLGAGRVYLPWALAGTSGIVSRDSGEPNVSVTPNPAGDQVVIHLDALLSAASGTVAGRREGIASATRVTIYDAGGRRVRTLNTTDGAEVTWDGRDGSGARVPSGVYFVRAEDGSSSASAGFALVR